MGTYSYSTTTSNDIINKTITTAGTYDIVAYGGAGGTAFNYGRAGGGGAEVGGDFTLTAGEKLKIVVGGQGGNASFGGGGGGTFVLGKAASATTYTLLVAAGGGGGGSNTSGGPGSSVQGTGGGGGGAGRYSGGGGAGYKSAGGSASGAVGGRGGSNGPSYAGGTSSNASVRGIGAFGGGGSAGNEGGGGGGGYTGGSGTYGGGTGGTSYLGVLADNTRTVRVEGENTSSGKVLVTPVCFCSGTLIRTARGDVAVEYLAVGDLAVTASGAHRPIRWLGHRDTDCSRHPAPRKVWPVRVAAGALGAGLPYADLWLSPGHALCLDEVLIPVRCLVHEEAVMQVERERVTYWHVELDSHDILIANGVPAESYLDTGNRRAFDNAPGIVDLHPDFEARSADGFCRPLVESGPLLSAARLKLFGAAPATPAPAPVHMTADGTVLHGMIGDNQAVFVVPAGTRDLRLVSSSFQAQAPDIRTLGVVIGSLTIEAASRPSRTVALDDPGLFAGFHEIERSDTGNWRWTDGDAHLAPSLWASIDGAFILRVGGIFPKVGHAEAARLVA